MHYPGRGYTSRATESSSLTSLWKSVLPVALRNHTEIQAEGREWTAVSHEKILGYDSRMLEKPQAPTTLGLGWQIAYNYPLFLLTSQLWVLHLRVSWRNTSTAWLLILGILDNRYRKKTQSHLVVHPCHMPYGVGLISKDKKDLKELTS